MELRCYNFGNFYMSSIQQGIQAAHSQMEMFNKYAAPLCATGPDQGSKKSMLFDWSFNYKTMICLNAGDLSGLIDLNKFLRSFDNEYPYAYFTESEDALGGIITNIALVLPEKIFGIAEKIRSGKMTWSEPTLAMFYVPQEDGIDFDLYGEFSEWEVELINRLNSMGLAK